jgi:excisionase family DNA binding protein
MSNTTSKTNELSEFKETVIDVLEGFLSDKQVNAAGLRSQARCRTYSIAEAAKILGVGKSAMWKAVHSDTIPSFRIGRRVLIGRATIDRLLNEGSLQDQGEANDD